MKHVMVDIEALGSKPPAVILSIGAVVFDLSGTHEEFYYRVDVGSSLLYGFHVDPATVQWWNGQDDKAKAAAFYCPGAAPIHGVLDAFSSFVNKSTYLWAKGPDYDCVFIAAAYERLGMPVPWSFRNNRDVRTILALSGVRQEVNADAHNALADAKSQADAVLRAHIKLGVQLQ